MNDESRIFWELRLGRILWGLGIAGLLGLSQAAMAEAITVGAFSAGQSVVNMEGAGNPPTGAFTYGGLTFSESSTGSGGSGWRNLTPTYGFTDNAGISNITIDLNGSYTLAGLDVGIGPANYQVNFFSSTASLLGSVTGHVTANTETFFAGWHSDSGVSRIQILELTGDNGYVGGFNHVHLQNTVSPVPEAQTLAMMFVGLGVLGFAARRRKA